MGFTEKKQLKKIGNGNWDCVKEVTTRLKSRKQPNATNGSSIQLGCRIRTRASAVLRQKCVLVQ